METKTTAFRQNQMQSKYPYVDFARTDFEKYPNFCSLLSTLATHLDADGLSVQTDKDLKQAEEVLRHEKHTWLLNNILYKECQELLLDYELNSLDVSLSSRDQQFAKVLQHSLTQAEIGDYLNFSPDPSSRVTTLGLTNEELDRQNQYKKHMPALQQALIPEVEERLRKRCENLVLVHHPESTAIDSSNLMFAKSSQLPAIVETDKLRLEEGQLHLKEDSNNKHKRFAAYYQKLLDSLELLESLISKFKLQHQVRQDTVTTEWLYAKCDAMCLKIKLLEMQILLDTYTVETLGALKKVSGYLDKEFSESQREKLHQEQAIKEYKAVGSNFEHIVSEFGEMKAELDNKLWALAEFDKSEAKRLTSS